MRWALKVSVLDVIGSMACKDIDREFHFEELVLLVPVNLQKKKKVFVS